MLDQILKRDYGRVVGLDLSWEATGWAALLRTFNLEHCPQPAAAM